VSNLTTSIEPVNLETQEIVLPLWRICRYKNKNQPPAARWKDAEPLNLGGDGGMKMRRIILPFVLLGSVFVADSLAQCIPVTSELVRGTCGGCHEVDSHLCMSRISYQRKTPEGWEDTVRRMGRMNGIPSSASQARDIIKYLADAQGLTSSEVQGIAYALEKQLNVQENVPNEDVKTLCTRCHSYARIAGERRSREEWLKLKDFHFASFPEELNSPDWPGSADKALNYLAERFPLDTPGWERERSQRPLAKGSWLVWGHEPGRGDYFGNVSISPSADGMYQTITSMEFANGEKEERTGEGVWYGGYAWRGSARSSNGRTIREVFELSPDKEILKGRWFLAQHPEIGAEEERYLDAGPTRILGILPRALQIPTSETNVTILGISLPANLQASDLDLGNNVKVVSILKDTSSQVVARVSILSGTAVGVRDVHLRGAVGPKLLGLYDTYGYIRVLPERGGARMGGVDVPKQLQQFEAVAYSDGQDGIAGTEDDFAIGTIHAKWEIGNYYYTYFADDKQFVGTIDQTGLFTPSLETSNQKRPETLNNAGSVWVVASYLPPDPKQSLQGRAYLLVAAPIYVKHDMP
jgi:quinohemoprotein amine dehydrogenase